MIPTATNYVYGKNICIELESRSTKILKRYAEHGIELYCNKIGWPDRLVFWGAVTR